MLRLPATAEAVRRELHAACADVVCDILRHHLRCLIDGVCGFVEEQPAEIKHIYYKAIGETLKSILDETLEHVNARSIEVLTDSTHPSGK